MSKFIHPAHLLSVGLAAFGFAFGYLVPALFFPAAGELYRITTSYGFGIMSFLLGERIFLSDTLTKAKNEIIESLNNAVYSERFHNIKDALDHVEKNAPQCKHIYNTRFASSKSVIDRAYLQDEYKRHDAAIRIAMEHGCNYHFCVDESAINDLGEFAQIHPIGKRKIGGYFLPKIINIQNKPVLQMILLEYKNSTRECLVGWEIGGHPTLDFPILLIRVTGNEAPTWQFFLRLFTEYMEQSDTYHEYIQKTNK